MHDPQADITTDDGIHMSDSSSLPISVRYRQVKNNSTSKATCMVAKSNEMTFSVNHTLQFAVY
jgi:hypothetical protein